MYKVKGSLMEEMMDIVDEDDRVIGRDTRKAVHKNYAIHRGIHILVLNDKGEILVQRRSQKKNDFPGFLDASVGGQVMSGETYEDAAHRELKEELGLSEDIVYMCDYNAYSPRQREKRRVFLCFFNGPFIPDPEEIEDVFFMSETEISEQATRKNYTEGFLKSFALYKKHKAKTGRPAQQ